ncbi:MAG: DUF222 domain-containing protein [Propionibacteriaceae bacterium]|nr:DUF222 domain-containing protein [Propionibacteriaceae bacterium]
MTTSSGVLPAGRVLAEVDALLDRVDPDRGSLDAAERLALVRTARRVRGRVDALAAVVTAEADGARASEAAAGTPMASWLGMGETVSRREAAGALRQARRLGQHPLVGEAAVAGRLGTSQARAITGVLDGLAPQLDQAQQARAEEVLVELAGHLDADQLAKAAGRVLNAVVPERADEARELQLQREAEAAHRQRSLRFFFEGASVRFDGSLPRLAAEEWIAQLDAHAEQIRRTGLERRDPLAGMLTPEQRRADSLIALIRATAGRASAAGRPGRDPEPPATARVLVRLDYDKLAADAAATGLVGDGQPLSAGELRRVCCDAEIIPVVLGSASEVLDVGRAERLVTPAQRAALLARDGGCVFPGCDAPPSRCEAHHVVPWYLGGATDLWNLVMLCHSHHPVIEPARFAVRDQWQVMIADDGLPEFTPPARLDPSQKPIRHRRHQPADRGGPTDPEQDTGPPSTAA